ncbi:MAG TPA: Sec-independent protein translocase protein TatB [Steroidobacteraceae bacterium]|nr:Sec-independent protein translocase protein TatB [Steroidobacteraceae bacterium]
MFEVGFTEILLILGIALLVLGPEKLPGLAEKVGRWTGRARAMARQLRTQLEHEVTMEEMTRSRPAQPASPPPPSSPEAAPATSGPELDLDATVSGIEPAGAGAESVEDAAADAAVAADVPLPKSAP